MTRRALPFLLAALLFPLAACSSGEAEDAGGDGSSTSAASAGETAGESEAGAEATTTGGEAEAICCGGACDTPAGYCCSDGTCGGNHEELPIHQP